MPLYIGDYITATQHLNVSESGAYLHLLMYEWKNGPLPSDEEFLRRIARVDRDAWSNTWGILRVFFKTYSDGRWIQERLERERVEWAKKRERNREKAVRAINKRWKNTAGNSSSIPQVIPENYASPSSSPTPIKDLNTSHDSPPRDTAVERIYQAYPRKVGKAKAIAAIEKAVESLGTGKDWPKLVEAEALDFLHKGVVEFAASPAGKAGEFTPHPATWFNQARYLDDPKEWKRNNDGTGNRGIRETGSREGAGQNSASARNARSNDAIDAAIDRFRVRPTRMANAPDESGVSSSRDNF
jgi:uncharacterized protein YdaU (DUF1376 family)